VVDSFHYYGRKSRHFEILGVHGGKAEMQGRPEEKGQEINLIVMKEKSHGWCER
jgi:hypothetical protein